MSFAVDDVLRSIALHRGLSNEDRARLVPVASVKSFEKGATIFSEGDSADFLYAILKGRVKVVKMIPSGREVILGIFGAGDPVGAVVAYEGRPYPASAVALESVSLHLFLKLADKMVRQGAEGTEIPMALSRARNWPTSLARPWRPASAS